MGTLFISFELMMIILIVSRGHPLVDGVVVVGKLLRYLRLVTRKSQLIQIGSVHDIPYRSLVILPALLIEILQILWSFDTAWLSIIIQHLT